MDRPLPVLPLTQPARTCVWADAGVIAPRLCDRAFACERCILDAALRGDARLTLRDTPDPAAHPPTPWSFPTDRLYADGHTWVQIVQSGRARAGIDACAAWFLPPILAASASPGSRIARGRPLCLLGFAAGKHAIASPISGLLHTWNAQLDSKPWLLESDPYGAGWIVEVTHPRSGELDGLHNAEQAAHSARLAARRFVRQAAFGLLCAAETAWVDLGLIEATRRLLGPLSSLDAARDCLL